MLVARPHDRRPVPRHRRALRAPPHAPARRVRRHLEADADLRGPVPDHRDGLGGPARRCRASSASSSRSSARSTRATRCRRTTLTPAASAPARRARATGVILGAVYLLYMFQKVFFGKLDKAKNGKLPDLKAHELIVFIVLVARHLRLGAVPAPAAHHHAAVRRQVPPRLHQAHRRARRPAAHLRSCRRPRGSCRRSPPHRRRTREVRRELQPRRPRLARRRT